MDASTETVVPWTRGRALHVVAPQGLLRADDLAVLRVLVKRRDDLDDVADALARLVGHPVRVRAWQPPTCDFFVEVETSSHG
jgi:hypothetical protein